MKKFFTVLLSVVFASMLFISCSDEDTQEDSKDSSQNFTLKAKEDADTYIYTLKANVPEGYEIVAWYINGIRISSTDNPLEYESADSVSTALCIISKTDSYQRYESLLVEF